MNFSYRELSVELSEDFKSFKVYDVTPIFGIEVAVMEGTSPEGNFTEERVKSMIDKELQLKIDKLLEEMDKKCQTKI